VYRSVNSYVIESVESGYLSLRILHQQEAIQEFFLHSGVVFEIERADIGFSIARIQRGPAK